MRIQTSACWRAAETCAGVIWEASDFESTFADFVTLRERDGGPKECFGQIFRNSTRRKIVCAERALRGDITLFGGALEPLHSLRVIARNILAIVIAHAHLPLGVCVSLIGEHSQIGQGLRLRPLTDRALIGRAMIGRALP